jgi:hypothetical protein
MRVVRQPQLVGRYARRDDLDDVRMVQACESARLELDPSNEVLSCPELRMQGLQGVALAGTCSPGW